MPRRDPYSYFGVSPQVGTTATTWSVGLATTHTGAVLSNPAGSGKTLILTSAWVTVSAAPAAIAVVGLFSGFVAAGITVHTTAMVVQTARIGDTENAVGLFDAAATLVGTPRWTEVLGTYPILAVFDQPYKPVGRTFDPHAMEYKIPPGAYIGIGAVTVVVGWASMSWYEVDGINV